MNVMQVVKSIHAS